MTPVVTSRHGVTLIGGGAVSAQDVALAVKFAPVVVGADGGADHALTFGLEPQAVIGDFDSLSPQTRAAIPPERLFHTAEQDSTDFEKCLTRISAPFVLAVGFAGPRLDHTLAALTVLARVPSPRCILLTQDDVVFLAPRDLTLPLSPGTRISLYPLAEVRGQSDGLEWPIDGLTLTPAGRIGTSNRAKGPVKLALDGPCLILLPRDCLAIAVAA